MSAPLRNLLTPHHTYVGLLSDHLLPNVIPVVAAPPRKVVLLYTPMNRDRVKRFRQATEALHFEVAAAQVDPYDYQNTQTVCEAILSEPAACVLNVTGGTKIMALAAFDVFRQHHAPIIYVNSDTQRLQFLHDRTSIALDDPLSVKQYLACYGYTLNNPASQQNLPLSWRNVGERLASESARWGRDLTYLNWIATNRQASFSLTETALTEALRKSGLIQPTAAVQPSPSYRFRSEEARQFINGGWFEHFVYSLLRQISSQYRLRDVLKNVTIHNGRIQNELDVLFIYRNRLHIIECKTRAFKNGQIDPTPAIYKLNTVTQHVAGIKGKAMLASYYPLSPSARQRCDDSHIVWSDQPSQLLDRLQRWITSES